MTQVIVTQADREEAAAFVAWHNKVASEWKKDDGSDLQFFMSAMPDEIRRGVWDNHDVVQAFARHRTQSVEQALAPWVDAVKEAREAADAVLAPLCASVGKCLIKMPEGNAVEVMHSYGVTIPFADFARLYEATGEVIDALLATRKETDHG